MQSIYGVHVINGAGPHLSDLQRLQPKLVIFLDPNEDDVRSFKKVSPNTIIVGRIYIPDSEIESRIRANPEIAALWAHNLSLANSAIRAGLIDFVQVANEILQFWDGLPLLNRFEVERMRLADSSGHKCGVLAFSVGQIDLPINDRLALWRLVYPTLTYAEAHNHVVVLHQYGAPDLYGPAEKGGAPWLINRLETQVLPLLPYKKIKFAICEYGIDGLLLTDLNRGLVSDEANYGVGVHTASKDVAEPTSTRGITGPAGWQKFTTATDYVKQLTDMGQWLEQYSNRILGYCIFELGVSSPWESYNIQGAVLRELADYYSSSQPPVVDPPIIPPEAPMTIKLGSYVDDFNLKIIPFEQRVDKAFWTSGPYYRIIQVFTTRDGSWQPSTNPGSIDQWAVDAWHSGADWKGAGGTNNFFIKVLDKAGNVVVGKGLYYWQGAMTSDPTKLTNINQKTTWNDGTENLPVWDSYNPSLGQMGKWGGTTVGRVLMY